MKNHETRFANLLDIYEMSRCKCLSTSFLLTVYEADGGGGGGGEENTHFTDAMFRFVSFKVTWMVHCKWQVLPL